MQYSKYVYYFIWISYFFLTAHLSLYLFYLAFIIIINIISNLVLQDPELDESFHSSKIYTLSTP